MKPPKGYKQTELGILPDNWKVVRLGEVCEIFDGTHQTPKYTKAGIPFFSVENITNNDFINTKFISKEEHEKLTKNNKLKKGDILMTRIGTLGICKVIDWDIEASYYVSLSLLRTKKRLFNIFLFQYSNCFNFRKEIDKNSLLLAIPPKINLGDISNLKIPLPPLREQEKIAEILNAADLELSSYEKLIALKEKYKKGLMQKLLTPKIRFKEFKEQWKVVKLGKICDITTGKLDANAMEQNGKYPYFTCAKEVYKINTFAYDTEALLISGNGANVGYIHYYHGKFNAYQRTYILDNFTNYNIILIKYILSIFLQKQINKEKNVGNIPYIRLATLENFNMKIPSSLKEQQKIAEVLSSCDAEIQNLKDLCALLKKQKHVLMQRLLSGKVRVKGT